MIWEKVAHVQQHVAVAGHPEASRTIGTHNGNSPDGPLVTLPYEILANIGRRLRYPDFKSLQRTSRAHHRILDTKFIHACLPRSEIRAHYCRICTGCRLYDDSPYRSLLSWMAVVQIGVPLTGRCADCAVARGLFSAGCHGYDLLGRLVYGCAWCGWPDCGAPHQSLMHSLEAVNALLVVVRNAVAVAAYALTLYVEQSKMVVLVPTIAGLIIWGSLIIFLSMICWNYSRAKFAHIQAALELILLLLVVPSVVGLTQAKTDNLAAIAQVLLIFHMVFRLLNAVGFAIMYCGCDPRITSSRGIAGWPRVFNLIAKTVIVWAWVDYLYDLKGPQWRRKNRSLVFRELGRQGLTILMAPLLLYLCHKTYGDDE